MNQVIATLQQQIIDLKNAIVSDCNGWIITDDNGLALIIEGNHAVPGDLFEATRFDTKNQALAIMSKFEGEYKVKSVSVAMLKEINTLNKLIKQASK